MDEVIKEKSTTMQGTAVASAMQEGFQVKRSSKQSADQHLLESATDALQAQERFFLHIRKRHSEQPELCATLLEEVPSVLESMRVMKSRIEGTLVDLPRPVLPENILQKLKTLMLMHMPRTMTGEVKEKFRSLLEELVQYTGWTLVYAGLSFCPWYASAQPELGQQAKHSTIFVVFTNPDHYTFSPANPHSKEQTEVIDEGWFYAVEASHFAKYLVKGKSRMVEALFTDEDSVILANHQWKHLLQTVNKHALLGLRPFLEQCRGQAIGGIAKKSKKTGQMRLNDKVTLYEFCESFKLLHNAVQAINNHNLEVSTLNLEELNKTFRTSYNTLATIYAHESDGRDKENLFDLLREAKSEVDLLMKGVSYTKPGDVDRDVGRWLLHLRAGEQLPVANPGLKATDRERLVNLMHQVGGPVSNMAPENIVVVVRAGSFLYDLHTPESDVDYLVIYTEPTESLLSSTKPLVECKENRGPNKEIEYGAYEARLFAEMLLKGSVVISEIVYVGEAEYASEAWKELCSHCHLFVTEHVIQQYLGLISNNMHTIQQGRYKGEPRERKLFYQIFHKLWSVEEMLKGNTPPVRCTGDIKDFIMSIRKGPLEGELAREKLCERAKNQQETVRWTLAERSRRLPENADLAYLTNWLMALRGWNSIQR